VDGVALDGLAVEGADGACVGVRGVGGAHDLTKVGDGILALESQRPHRAGGHVGDEVVVEGPFLVDRVKSPGLGLGQVHEAAGDDVEAFVLEVGDYLAGVAVLDGVGLDDCQSALGHGSSWDALPRMGRVDDTPVNQELGIRN